MTGDRDMLPAEEECFSHDTVDTPDLNQIEENIRLDDGDEQLKEHGRDEGFRKEEMNATYEQFEESSSSDRLIFEPFQTMEPEMIVLKRSRRRSMTWSIVFMLFGILFGVLLSMLWRTVIGTATSSSSEENWKGWQSIENVFTFGDSWTGAGFEPDNAQPSPENPIGNPPFPGISSANATNWVGFLTAKYNTTFLKTYNLAVGGASLDNSIIQGYPIPVTSQVYNRFMPYYGLGHQPYWSSTNSLFIMFDGVVDLVGMNKIREPEMLSEVNGKLTAVYTKLLDTLYGSGARNFLLMGTPPLERCWQPGEDGPSISKKLKTDGIVYNQRVRNAAEELKKKYTDPNVWLFDTEKLFNQALDDPKSFPQTSGILNTTKPCAAYHGGTPTPDYLDATCEIPVNQYFWLNELHPTYPIHDAMAEQIVKLLELGPNIN